MVSSPRSVLILAAGQGKRMHSSLPKVLHGLSGTSLLGHVLRVAKSLQPTQLSIVHGHGAERVRDAFGHDADLSWVLQEPPQGTGDAVRQAFDQQGVHHEGLVVILYGDVPLLQPETLERLVASAETGTLTLLTETLENPRGYGRILRDTTGAVTGVVEEKDATDAQRRISEVNTGMLAASRDHLDRWVHRLQNENAQGEYYLTDIVAMAREEGVRIETCQPRWPWEAQGVNDKRQLASLERAWQRHLADQLLDQGVTLLDPTRLDIRGKMTVGRDVVIDVGCVFEGVVTLGDNVTIGPNVVIRDSTIAAGAEIRAMSHLDTVTVGRDARIGPYARLRPGTVIGEAGHVGNFVEIKNATLGFESKANHLAYVGDAQVGDRVNIGAGVITCNYDGAQKHQTIIEDDVFIGSDTQLVAPVRVGQGATIGAGTTLTADAPDNQLTVSRARQRSIPGWRRPQKK